MNKNKTVKNGKKVRINGHCVICKATLTGKDILICEQCGKKIKDKKE